MVVDRSAIIAILYDEPEWQIYLEALRTAANARMAAPTRVEVGIVIRSNRGTAGTELLELLLDLYQVEVVAFDEKQAGLALNTGGGGTA